MLKKFPINKVVTGLLFVCLSQSVQAKVLLELDGDITQGGLVVGSTNPGNAVYLDKDPLKVSRHGLFTLGFSRDDDKTHELKIVKTDGEKLLQYLTPTKRKYNVQSIEGIDKKIMEPSAEALKQIAKDSIQIRAARAISSDNIDFAHGFKAPATGRITGVYGSQRIYNGVPKNPHYGLDYAGPKGTAVKSPAAGIITLWSPNMFYSGGTLIIDHGHGITSTFLHLSASKVEVGDKVLQGQPIAEIGSTGRSTGPHLDWRVNWHNVRLDPALALTLPNSHTFKAKKTKAAE
ncbi:M23 family metallopeptidase [Thalassotalea psychrophila]|uniref:M23 family metallopeptidase n=1 Tax=Thalassotalea psychrophila TaxID=3065647 RepID=A0ABY9TNT4_9GAMM|nr:M23 family metallopeptidase [Colwelliaceae bacterium SQ149]